MTKKKVSATSTKKIKTQKVIPATKNIGKRPKPVPEKSVVNENPISQSHSILPKKRGQERTNTEFESQMDKVNGLIKEGYIRQAYSAIPNETKFPERAAQIKTLKSELMDRIWNL
jgi:hypothetical protein